MIKKGLAPLFLIAMMLISVLSFAVVEKEAVVLTPPSKGAGTELVIYEYSDFQCSYCAKVDPTINKRLADYGDRIKLVYKQFPLPAMVHKDAMKASQASVAALMQGKFWEMHDMLFRDQRKLKMENLLEYAKELNLDIEKFKKDMESEETQKMIADDIAEGTKIEVLATPTFIIGETSILGAKPYETFKQIIDDEISKAKKIESTP